MLTAFVNQVGSLRDDGVLAVEQAANLVGSARTVIETHPAS